MYMFPFLDTNIISPDMFTSGMLKATVKWV